MLVGFHCHEVLVSLTIKGIRDAGSTADFRILFEILKFKNLKTLKIWKILEHLIFLEHLENFEKFLRFGKI